MFYFLYVIDASKMSVISVADESSFASQAASKTLQGSVFRVLELSETDHFQYFLGKLGFV